MISYVNTVLSNVGTIWHHRSNIWCHIYMIYIIHNTMDSELWYPSFNIWYHANIIGFYLWYVVYDIIYSLYDIIFVNMVSYVTASTTQRNPGPAQNNSLGAFQCINRLSSQTVCLVQYLSSSLWFNRLSEASSIWFREIFPQSGDFSQHMVATHCDVTWLVRYLSDVASCMSTLFDLVYNQYMISYIICLWYITLNHILFSILYQIFYYDIVYYYTDDIILYQMFYYDIVYYYTDHIVCHIIYLWYITLINIPPPSSVVVNTQGRESGGSWFKTCSGVWYPRRRPCGVAINTLVDLINWLGKPQVFFLNILTHNSKNTM